MAHFSSEIQDEPPKNESTGSETTIRSPLCDYTLTEDSVLRSMIEEAALQALCEEVVIKMPHYTFSISETDELNDFISLNFPQKLWKIVESDQFKYIWWDESGTSIVINEEVFKKEVLERKAPFRIFETNSMKSLVRQLNLYGFRKKQQTFQRSASLADFLEEANNASVLSKLQIYHNPNFKRGYPQLLVRMKRRVRIKNVSPISSLVRDYKKKHVKERGNIDDRNSNFLPETSGQSAFSASTSLSRVTAACGQAGHATCCAVTSSPLTAAPARGQGQGHVESETQPEEGQSHGGLWTFVVVILGPLGLKPPSGTSHLGTQGGWHRSPADAGPLPPLPAWGSGPPHAV
ncbi:unnamed protein product, partial [Rangifer tarandus platyrhynchus]